MKPPLLHHASSQGTAGHRLGEVPRDVVSYRRSSAASAPPPHLVGLELRPLPPGIGQSEYPQEPVHTSCRAERKVDPLAQQRGGMFQVGMDQATVGQSVCLCRSTMAIRALRASYRDVGREVMSAQGRIVFATSKRLLLAAITGLQVGPALDVLGPTEYLALTALIQRCTSFLEGPPCCLPKGAGCYLNVRWSTIGLRTNGISGGAVVA